MHAYTASVPRPGAPASLAMLGRVGAADYSTAPLTEPDMRTRIRLLGLISDCQHKLVGDPWGVQLVPARLERDHPIAKPCGRVGFRHARPVRFHPTPLAAVRSPGGRLSTDLAGQQMSEQEAWPLLLAYDDRPDPAANMGVDDPKFRRRLRRAEAVVRHPSVQLGSVRP